MNGELARCMTLATHATAWLRRRQTSPAGFELPHSTMQFVDSIIFDDVAGVDGWMRRLVADGVDRVWLAVPDLDPQDDRGLAAHKAAAFAGGTQLGLLTTGAAGNRLWQARSQIGDRDAPDQRIWIVTYRSQPVSSGPLLPDLQEAARLLDQALQHAEEFASHNVLPPWDELFAEARRQWSSGEPRNVDHQDLFPDHWGHADSHRLACMAQAAWVFGGMGSWNDLQFDEPDRQREYETISRDLFAAVIRACVAAVNAEA
ncbi:MULTISPECIES: hypothetical protein [unclassified Nocardia]|uniref:hypothetical protein n=1 Tax=unclassified Nocardia TaxID=2637762 RepID=UPI001CE4B2AF|nr:MULTISPECIES: hypothetical protein [unclassified Nocardia]